MSTVENPSLAKLLAACVFPGGLTMVLLAGSELFTGNCLLVIPLLQRQISWGGMLRNWLFVYLGNLLGSLLVVGLVALGGQWSLCSGQLAVTTIKVAAGKLALSFPKAVALGVCCNFLVCIAVWISFDIYMMSISSDPKYLRSSAATASCASSAAEPTPFTDTS